MEITRYKSNIIKKEYLNSDTILLQLEKPKNYDFKPGQFLQTIFPEGKRSYSIFSKPSDKTLNLCIKLFAGGLASEIFKRIEVGEKITISETMGHFIITEEDVERTYCATGSGLAPIVSMIKTALEDYGHQSRMYLIFGLRHEENIFYQEEIEKLAKKYDNFHFDITLSQPNENWQGMSGRITAHLPEKVLNKKNNHFYLCGSPEMVKDVRKLLIENGVEVKNIKFEIF